MVLKKNNDAFLQFLPQGILGIAGYEFKNDFHIQNTFFIPGKDHTHHDSQQQISEEINKFFEGKSGSHHCTLVLHRSQYSVCAFELPAGSESELQSMVEIEAEQRLPYPTNELCFGWDAFQISDSDSDRLQINLFWTPTHKIQPQLDICNLSGLIVTRILPALPVWRGALMQKTPKKSFALVHHSTFGFETAIWNPSGALDFSRGRCFSEHPAQSQDKPDPDVVATIDQIIRRNPAADFFSVENSQFQRLSEVSERQFKLISLQEYIPENSNGAFSGDNPDLFLPLLLTAQSHCHNAPERDLSCHLDMLPADIIKKRNKTHLFRLLCQNALILLGIIVFGSANVWFYVHALRRQIEDNNAQIETLQPEAKIVDAMEQRIFSIREQIEYTLSPIDALEHISQIFNDNTDALNGLYLDRMLYKASGEILLEGHAKDGIAPWTAAELLQKDSRLEVSKKPQTIPLDLGGSRSTRFHLKITVIGSSIQKESIGQ